MHAIHQNGERFTVLGMFVLRASGGSAGSKKKIGTCRSLNRGIAIRRHLVDS
jgi:hypothetical protein